MGSEVLRSDIGFGLGDGASGETTTSSPYQMAANEVPRDLFGWSIEEA
jgi:hypothetical protein